MKLVRNLIIALVMLILSTINVFASETKDVSFKATISGDNVTVEETTITGELDNSNLQVQVIKKVGEQSTVIYVGRLGDYENGKWSDVDFNSIQILAVIDYNALFGNAEQELIYIIPLKTQSESTKTTMQANQNITAAENTVELQSALTTQTIQTIQTNISLMYNDKYCENVLLPGETLNVSVSITNSGTTSVEIVSYIAEYDLSGRLIDLTQGSVINAPANQTVTATLSNEFSADVACTVKVFFWQKDNLKPIAESIYLTVQNQDYYADTYAESNKIEIDKIICGVINTSTDVDIVKFTPSNTGLYALQLDGSNGTTCNIYDNTQTLLNSVSVAEDKKYLLYSLTANQDYYISVSGVENNSYNIKPTLPSELIPLAKNIGTANNLSENNDYDVYKFTPTTSGMYIITAVDSINVTAELYNSSFEKVASADTTDSTVSFRITDNMIANQAYYIVVYPKSETNLGSYTMYVEEPFALISVE